MAVSVSNFSKNIVVIENLDLSLPVSYKISKMNDEGQFEAATGFPDDPTNVLAAGATTSPDLSLDGVYLLTLAGSPNTEYYFLLDYNLKLCGKQIMEEILCDTCGQTDACGKQAHYLKIEQLMKYSTIKNALYYIYNEIVQTQSVTDLIAADSAKLMLLSDLTDKLNLICENCQDDEICKNIYDSNGNPTGNGCGCS
jgi:hypothetical protein